MNREILKAWLRKQKVRGFYQNEALGIGALIGGLLVLFFTFWFTYAVIWFGAYGASAISELLINKKFQVSHEVRLLCSGIFVVLLFVQHFRTDPHHWGEYPERDYASAPVLQAQAGMMGGMGFMLAYPGASANMVADILLVGPRLVAGGVVLMKRGFQIKNLDEEGCAELLAFLHSQIKAAPYEELKGAGWEQWFQQLGCIEGVQFLQGGIILSGELRNELSGLSMN
jgi:hypothetical protein